MIENLTALPGVLQPLASSVNSLMGLVRILVGGVFGLYIIVFVWRVIEARRLRKTISRLENKINQVRAAVKRIEKSDRKDVIKKLDEFIKNS